MSYDALAERIILVGTRQARRVPPLSRRRRFAAMAVDVAGDIATTMFLRRSVGCDVQETWVLTLQQDQWCLLGGEGGTVEHEAGLLADRPVTIPDDTIRPGNTLPGVDPHIVTGGNGAGGAHDTMSGRDLFPWSGRWISYTTLFASAQVEAIEMADRKVAVPWHGHTLITWIGRRPPRIGIRGTGGQLLASTRIPTSQP
jgi:hypothetical protein